MKTIRLTDRDLQLLGFLTEYKIISLDNTRYIYDTVTYQEKRIVKLVKFGYLKRLKHRYIALGINGKNLMIQYGATIINHNRNANNLERLNVISDIASFIAFNDNMSFTASWQLKDIDSPTTRSRRYLGVTEISATSFLTYSIYKGKTKKYITSIYYDIKKENTYNHIIIFTNDIKELIYRKKDFSFGKAETLLILYTEYNKFILRHYINIKQSILENLKSKYTLYESDIAELDFILDDGRYIKIMPFIDMEVLNTLKWHFDIGYYKDKNINIFCLEENVDIVKDYLPKVNCVSITKQEIQDMIIHKKSF